MLRIEVQLSPEGWDEEKEEFVESKTQVLQLEHSLVSLSKWEAKWCKPFLSKDERTYEETIDYIRCMTITQNVNPDVYKHLSNKNIEDVNKYIQASMTATWFVEDRKLNGRRGGSSEQITSELIYYWMISENIPVEFERWHINRLMTLIKVCNIKNTPPKKMGRRELMNRNAALNASRRQRFNSRG